jgi:hypothetical protein
MGCARYVAVRTNAKGITSLASSLATDKKYVSDTNRKVALEFREWTKAGLGPLLLAWQALFMLREANNDLWRSQRLVFIRKFMTMCRAVGWNAGEPASLVQAGYVTTGKSTEVVEYGPVKNLSGSVLARRIQAILFLTNVGTAGETTDSARQFDEEEGQVLNALLAHLSLYGQVYTSRWLRWIEKVGGRVVFGVLVNSVLSEKYKEIYEPSLAEPFAPFRGWYKLEELVINDTEILVPIDLGTETKLDGVTPTVAPSHHPWRGLVDSLINLDLSVSLFNAKLVAGANGQKWSTEIYQNQEAHNSEALVQSMLATSNDNKAPTSRMKQTRKSLGRTTESLESLTRQQRNEHIADTSRTGGPASTTAIVNLGNPWDMERSSSVDVLANGVYVAGKFE